VELLALVALLLIASSSSPPPLGGRDRVKRKRGVGAAGELVYQPEEDSVSTSTKNPDGTVTTNTGTWPVTADPENWIWPLRPIDAHAFGAARGGAPTISDGWGSARGAHGGQAAHTHAGADIMFERAKHLPKDAKGRCLTCPPHESSGYFVPEGTPVVAAHAGKVWSVAHTTMGIRIVIDHGKPWATVYQHLESTTLPLHHKGKQHDGSTALTVEIGEPLGVVGYDPSDSGGVRHLHFELWHGNAPVDPWPSLQHWRVLR
jgi:hypothetical protein